MRRAPAKPGVCAVCECVAPLPSRNMTCVRPPCTARSREDSLDTSQFRLPSLHFKGHTSSHLKLHCNIFFHTANFYTEKPFNTEVLRMQNTCSAAKHNSITHAAVAPRNLDAASKVRFADTALQNKIQLCTACVTNYSSKTGSRRPSWKKARFCRLFTKKNYWEALKCTKFTDKSHAAIPLRFTLISCERQ